MKDGHTRVNAIAKVCQDIILKEISKSPYFRNVTKRWSCNAQYF